MYKGTLTARGSEYKNLARSYLHMHHIKFTEVKAGWRTTQFLFEGTHEQCLDLENFSKTLPSFD